MSAPAFRKLSPKTVAILILSVALAFVVANAFTSGTRHTGNMGIIVHGERSLEILEDDKTTNLTSIDWGLVAVSVPEYKYAWVNTEYTYITWSHDAPNYIQLRLVAEVSPNVWVSYSQNQNITVTGQWLHFYLQLTVQPTTDTTFSFYITFMGVA